VLLFCTIFQVVGSGEVPERDFSLLHNLCWVGGGNAVTLASASGLVYTFNVRDPVSGGPYSTLSFLYMVALSALGLLVAMCVGLRASPATVLASFLEY
jgi:hypothetical protein